MTLSSSLTLAQATSSIQLALEHAGRLDAAAGRIASDIFQPANEALLLALPGWAQQGIDRLRTPPAAASHEKEVRRSLAYLAAEIGRRESAGFHDPSEDSSRRARSAIDEIFSRLPAFSAEPRNGFLARVRNPESGFRHFRTNRLTEVAFFPTPESLGAPWDRLIRGHWANGVGLVIFRNEEADAVGMIFLHSLGRVTWSKLAVPAWQSSGGSMAFPADALTFAQALERVVDKGVAMTWKWRAVDDSLRNGNGTGERRTGLGGSKGLVLFGRGEDAREKAFRVYAEVLALLGVTLTGSDEGVDPDAADFLAELAPLNVYGSAKSRYKGRKPTEYTARGIFEVLKAVATLGGNPFIRRPVLAVGYGGIGEPLVRSLMKENMPISGVVERDAAKLGKAGRQGVAAPLFRDLTGIGWTPAQILSWPYWRARGIRPKADLARIVEAAPQTRIVTPNGGPHPITFDVAQALIAGGVEAVAGAANNQLGFDAHGSPLPLAWILQAAGIFNPADFVANRLGATAVVSMAIGLSDYDMRRQVEKAGDSAREDYRAAFEKGEPPFVYRWRKAANAWNAIVASGAGVGGVTDWH